MKYTVQQFTLRGDSISGADEAEFSNENDARMFYDDIDLKFDFDTEVSCSPSGTCKDKTFCKELVIEDDGDLYAAEHDEYGWEDWKRDHA